MMKDTFETERFKQTANRLGILPVRHFLLALCADIMAMRREQKQPKCRHSTHASEQQTCRCLWGILLCLHKTERIQVIEFWHTLRNYTMCTPGQSCLPLNTLEPIGLAFAKVGSWQNDINLARRPCHLWPPNGQNTAQPAHSIYSLIEQI